MLLSVVLAVFAAMVSLASAVSLADDLIEYAPPRKLAELDNRDIDESSGLACSRRTADVLWTHNDSGDAARLYAFDPKGNDLGSVELKDVAARDFEDMASFELDGRPWLLVGDVGNNGLKHEVHVLYLLAEPEVDARDGVARKTIPVTRRIHFRYAGRSHDCEALAVDASSRTVLLASKQIWPPGALIYSLELPEGFEQSVDEPAMPLGGGRGLVARPIGAVRVGPVTAMDVSPDGRRMVLLTYGDAFEFQRGEEETWSAALKRRPRKLTMPLRLQGESLCYGSDGRTLYLTSEKLPTPLWEVSE